MEITSAIAVPGGQETRRMLTRVHQDALRILEEVGVRCTSLEIQNLLADTGLAAYDETTGHLHVLAPLVEQALATAPGRDAYWIPPNSFGVGGTDSPGSARCSTMRRMPRMCAAWGNSLRCSTSISNPMPPAAGDSRPWPARSKSSGKTD